ncbi:MAG TPA: hypothetical protein GYA05_04985 [Acholeplasmataceae bacterium]|jgi:lysine-N-methylase|nr:hypothetical protein [Acholeplasmataceae bacterium]
MLTTRMFTVPVYYRKFKCKGGDCRNSCCKGWDVTMSTDDYFILQGMDCSKKLRELLDRHIRILPHPTPDRYALIEKTFDGDCPFHMTNGYCMLHTQCGEKVLPNICHYFP